MNSRERILLVDDEPKMHSLLRVCLVPLGYEIESAAAGIPVILLTVKGQVDDPDLDHAGLDERIAEQMKGYDVGAVDFIPKPVKAGELLERIKSHLMLDRMAAARTK